MSYCPLPITSPFPGSSAPSHHFSPTYSFQIFAKQFSSIAKTLDIRCRDWKEHASRFPSDNLRSAIARLFVCRKWIRTRVTRINECRINNTGVYLLFYVIFLWNDQEKHDMWSVKHVTRSVANVSRSMCRVSIRFSFTRRMPENSACSFIISSI